MSYTATIVRSKKDGVIHIRVSSKGPQTGGDVELIEILQGEDEEELKERAVRYAQEKIDPQ